MGAEWFVLLDRLQNVVKLTIDYLSFVIYNYFMYKNYKNSPVHNKTLDSAYERYLCKSTVELNTFLGIYKKLRRDAISSKDSRWKIPQDEGRLSVKEHIFLINEALKTKKPIKPVTITCKPAIMGIKKG